MLPCPQEEGNAAALATKNQIVVRSASLRHLRNESKHRFGIVSHDPSSEISWRSLVADVLAALRYPQPESRSHRNRSHLSPRKTRLLASSDSPAENIFASSAAFFGHDETDRFAAKIAATSAAI
jgi:hypothetical protein